MKKIILLILPLLIFGCKFNIEKKKDLLKKITYTETGLTSDDVFTKINAEKEKRDEFIFGEKIEVVFNGVTGFVKEDGLSYPGMEMFITSEDGEDTLYYEENVLTEYEEGMAENTIKIEAFFVNTLFENKYKLSLKAYDFNGEGTFDFEMPFEVIKNERISVVGYGLEAKIVYLYDETAQEVVEDNIIDINHKISLIINGIEGLNQEDSLIRPVFSAIVTDANEKVIMENENLFQAYDLEGVSLKDVEQQISAFLQFTYGSPNNPYKVKASFIESKTGKKIEILTFLNIKN